MNFRTIFEAQTRRKWRSAYFHDFGSAGRTLYMLEYDLNDSKFSFLSAYKTNQIAATSRQEMKFEGI
jgi:hypothetical protein